MLIQDIVNTLRNNILTGKINPGDKLPSVQDMQKTFGVGRGTVREALKVMEGMGLLRIKKGRSGGAFLTEHSDLIISKSLSDFFQVEESNILSYLAFRRIIEPRMARNASLLREQQHIDSMEAALQLISGEVVSRDKFVKGTSDFFKAVTAANRNEHLDQLFDYTLSGLVGNSKLIFEVSLGVELSKHFYGQIYQAILDGAPEKAEMLSDAYLLQLEDKVKYSKNLAGRSVSGKGVIKWGLMADLSGTLMDYGKQIAMGMMDAARYLNEKGGIKGKRIELVIRDDKYKVSESRKAYEEFKRNGVAGIYIHSTGSTQVLIPRSTSDRVFLFTSANSNKLMNPATAPYHFTVGPTYGDISSAAVKFIHLNWRSDTRTPRLAFMFPENPYGREHFEAAKNYAIELGMKIGSSQIVNWPTLDASRQLLEIKKDRPDYIFLASSTLNAANILKDAKRLGVDAQFICNMRVFTEDLPKLAMGAAEGVLGIQPFAPYGLNVPGMKKITKCHDLWHPHHQATLVYVEGWLNMLIPAEACKIADQAGGVNTEMLKSTLETFRNFDSGGLIPPVSYYEEDHRSTTKAKIYKIKNSEFIPIVDSIGVERNKNYYQVANQKLS